MEDEIEQVDFDSIKESINTFDIFLLSGTGNFSKIIKCFTETQYTHIGIVITEDALKKIGVRVKDRLKSRDNLYLFHSNKGSVANIPDVVSGNVRSGVQLNDLRDIIDHYNGVIYYRKILGLGDLQQYYDKLKKSYEDLKDREYENDYSEMFCAMFRWPIEQDTSTLFCSELVAQVYIDTGIFTRKSMPSDNYLPCDFAENAGELPFKKGVKLGEQKELLVLQ
jgi:hypothetical protein